MRRIGARRILLGLGVVIVAGVATGAVIAASMDDGRELIAAIDEAPLVQVADIPSADGLPGSGVFVQVARTGHLCVWETPSATSRRRGGGCNTADDPLNGRPISFTLSYDGGPNLASVRSASLFGLASSEVATASVLMSDGSQSVLKLKKTKVGSAEYQAFGFRFKSADLRKGIGPTAVVARDASGAEIARQVTGIGS